MSNLLPPAAKNFISAEYTARLAVAWFFAGSVTCIVVAILFVPSYILVSSELSYAEGALLKQSTDTSTKYASTLKEINQANALGTRLVRRDTTIEMTDVLKEVHKELGTAIEFVGITITRQSGGDPIIEMRGVATTRDELAHFVDRLKVNPYIADASVPFSELAQAVHTSFTATIRVRDGHKKVTP